MKVYAHNDRGGKPLLDVSYNSVTVDDDPILVVVKCGDGEEWQVPVILECGLTGTMYYAFTDDEICDDEYGLPIREEVDDDGFLTNPNYAKDNYPWDEAHVDCIVLDEEDYLTED